MNNLKKIFLSILCGAVVLTNTPITVFAETTKPIAQENVVFDYELELIHGSGIPYWEWTNIDQTYIDEKLHQLSSSEFESLMYEEMNLIQTQKEYWESKYLDINGITFYPSAVVGMLHSIDLGLTARANALSLTDSGDLYPSIYDSNVIPFKSYSYRTSIIQRVRTEEDFEKAIRKDKEILSVLKDIPKDKIPTNGLKILAVPYQMRLEDTQCSSLEGMALSSQNLIMLSSYLNDPASTIYHEMGHIWAINHLTDYSEYLSIRGQTNQPKATGAILTYQEMTSSVEENFADDYAQTMNPYKRELVYQGSYGKPDQTTKAKLQKFYSSKESLKRIKSLDLDGMGRFTKVYLTNKNFLEISGYSTADFEVKVVTPDNKTNKIPVKANNGSFKVAVPLDKIGTYRVDTPMGNYIVLKQGILLKSNNKAVPEKKNSWSILGENNVPSNLVLKAMSEAYPKGVWVENKGSGSYIMISNGNNSGYTSESGISIKDVNISEQSIDITVGSGSSDREFVKIPISDSAKKINVTGLSGTWYSESISKDLIMLDDYNDNYLSSDFMIDYIIRSQSGSVYLVIENNGQEVYSNTFTLLSSYPHFNSMSHTISLDNLNSGNVKISFYEDLSMSKLIGTASYRCD